MAYNLYRNIEKNHNRYQSDTKRPLQFSGELSQMNVPLGWAQANVGRYQTNQANNKFGKQEQGLTETVTWDTSPDVCLGSQKPVGPPGKARCHVDEVQEQSVFFKITQKPSKTLPPDLPTLSPQTGANRNRTTWKWKEVKGKRKWRGSNHRMPHKWAAMAQYTPLSKIESHRLSIKITPDRSSSSRAPPLFRRARVAGVTARDTATVIGNAEVRRRCARHS